jgi:hypothetical protein
MTASQQKKAEKKTEQPSKGTATTPAAEPVSTASTKTQPLPALVAYHAIPAPKGQPPVLVPIGSAVAHPDGEGFTLQLQLMPTIGGQIVLRKPKIGKSA